MSRIVLLGASGNIGSRILDEALQRGHQVTALSRTPEKISARYGMTAKAANTADISGLATTLAGHDCVVASVKWNENDIAGVIDAIRRCGVQRALFVVGAGSLIRADGRTHFDHMAEKGVQPPTSKPAMLALEAIRKVADLGWTAISPPASIQPGARTAAFRLGQDELLEDAKGESRISREDFAVAILDEIEVPRHIHQRFTAAY